MLAVCPSATLVGLDGRVIAVEVDVAPGLPGFTVVGLADTAVQEARERVRGAIRNAGFTFPPRRITVSLAPADVRKAGASLDLAMAIGILLGTDQLSVTDRVTGLIGELSLGGEIRSVPGILPMVAALRDRGIARVIVPDAAVDEARLVAHVVVRGAHTLAEAVDALRRRPVRGGPVARPRVTIAGSDRSARAVGRGADADQAARDSALTPDLADVRGQRPARRAIEIALAGGHGLLLYGPPGVGKTLLARTIPSLLPDLDDAAALEVTVVASAAGEGPIHALRRRPPFRSPHHTASYAAMVGGGPTLGPGEVTRADRGVLFLDELPEFDRDVLEALRQPLEEGRVLIARAGRTTVFPCRFQLVAAMNPCPCGFAGAFPEGRCSCTGPLIDRYQQRVSGPLRDRLDLWVPMPEPSPADLLGGQDPEASAVVAARVAMARSFGRSRHLGLLNGRLRGAALRAACRLDAATAAHLVEIVAASPTSGRGAERVLRVARTVADLDGRSDVRPSDLDEAAAYHPPIVRSAHALAS